MSCDFWANLVPNLALIFGIVLLGALVEIGLLRQKIRHLKILHTIKDNLEKSNVKRIDIS